MSNTMRPARDIRFMRIAGMAVFMAALLPCPHSRAQDIVAPADTHNFVNQIVTVRGTVAGVYTSGKGNTFLNFGAPYPRQQLSGVIFASDAPLFKDVDLGALEGHTVSITGVVKLYKGKPEIVLKRRDQLIADK